MDQPSITTNDTVHWTSSTIRREPPTLRKRLVAVHYTGEVIEPVGRHLLRVKIVSAEDKGRVVLVARDRVSKLVA